MRKIKYKLEVGFCGCDDEDVMEIEGSDAEIDSIVYEMAQEWATNWEGDQRLYDDWDEETVESFYENVCGSWEELSDEEFEEYQ